MPNPEAFTRDKSSSYFAGGSLREAPRPYSRKRLSAGFALRDADIQGWLPGGSLNTHVEHEASEEIVPPNEAIYANQGGDISEYYLAKPRVDDPRDYIRQYISLKREAAITVGKLWSLKPYTAVGRITFEWPAFAGESAEERFARLAGQWKQESAFMSSITDKVMLLSYQQIIGMGWPAIPLMLADLMNEPEHWFWALRAITDKNPVPPEDAGDMEGMARAWINWGRKNFIIE